MTREEVLSLSGDFTWDFGQHFFIETPEGNFIWSDPDYGGDHTLRRTTESYKQWIGDGVGRSKGLHSILGYCGSKVTIIEE